MSRADTTAAVTSTGTLFAAARRLCDRTDARLARRRRLCTQRTEPSRTMAGGVADGAAIAGRLTRYRCQVVPWLGRTRTLEGARILEVGSDGGVSTIALAEQGARVVEAL